MLWTDALLLAFHSESHLHIQLGFIYRQNMLALSSASMGFAAPAAALAPSLRSAAPMMRKSEALPFLEAPAHCDGTLAGDVVRKTSAA